MHGGWREDKCDVHRGGGLLREEGERGERISNRSERDRETRERKESIGGGEGDEETLGR